MKSDYILMQMGLNMSRGTSGHVKAASVPPGHTLFLLKVHKFTIAAYPLEFKFITMESEIHAHSTFLGCLWLKVLFLSLISFSL